MASWCGRLLLGAAVAGLVAVSTAAVDHTAATVPLYMVKAPFSEYESAPFNPTAQAAELSFSGLPGLLAHTAGVTRNVPPIEVQQWAGSVYANPSFGSIGDDDRAVAAISIVGVEPNVLQYILPMVAPAFFLKDVPRSTDKLLEAMTDITDSIVNSGEPQLRSLTENFGSGAIKVAVNGELASVMMPSPRPADEVVASFNDRYATSIFDPANQVDAAFIREVEYIANVFETLSDKNVKFVGVAMGALQNVLKTYGLSHKYDLACEIVQQLLVHTVIPKFLEFSKNDGTVVLLMSKPGNSLQKRSLSEPDHVLEKRQASPAPTSTPTGTPTAASPCPQDQAACEAQTNKCSGRGDCVKNKLGCFRCRCKKAAPSPSSNTLLEWAGDSCQYINAAPQFFILWGTGIVLLLTVLAVSVLIINMGGSMDSGSTAGAGAGGIKTD